MAENWIGALEASPASIDDLRNVSKELLGASNGRSVWLFFGEMGAGKTTLIKAICSELGVVDLTGSPTFSIINEYKTAAGASVYHFDFYRIKSELEAFDIGVEEYFESGNYCFVEWPERIPSHYPLEYFMIRIKEESKTHRLIEYKLS
ncbi:MAG: tRNA (adenosine(37)-N6)-threonylcarbamoyltransferase complex ATPase subunit type 1 TsaE [Cyclobacteriaceae bacterium]